MVVEKDGIGEAEESPVTKLDPHPFAGESLKKGSMLIKDTCMFNLFIPYRRRIRCKHAGREGIIVLERIGEV